MDKLQTAQLYIPPDVVDFGAGQPSPHLLPLAALREAAANRLANPDPAYLAYGNMAGDGYFLHALAEYLAEHYQVPVDYENLFITAGASQGLDLICTLFSRPGDTIFVEEPSYFLALRIFADHGLKVVSLPMDEQGLDMEALEQNLTRHAPAFLYTIPSFHNPSSVTLAAERREQVVQLSRQHDLLIVADEVYHLLNFDAVPPPPLARYIDQGPVISLGSFSKIMAPGVRLGWIQTGAKLIQRLADCGLVDSGGSLNAFTSGVMRSAIELGLLEKQLTKLKTVYNERKIALSNALRELLPDTVRFVEPEGGFFIWLEFADLIDTSQLLAAARRLKVGFLPGINFSSRGALKNCARLSFAYFDVPELEEGARRLARAVNDYALRYKV
ncbi:Transcriptional regulator, GntR family domain / Aspartate aminotransferase (EC [Olavius algarvensis Delta 1 endosymbiont]|nr:Transcriptional regulator, GntR family domain / Aspartate aminotransferase (EC [Olavius algarvensis Delta 1 endosymbiont]